MIDLHTHILPGMDDGAANIEEAMLMSEAFRSQLVDTVACTSHYDPTKFSLEEYLNKRTEAMKKLEFCRITLKAASETYLHEYLFHYPELSQLCIFQTDYLLVELPCTDKWEDNIYSMMERLIHYYHVIPIIAHIERYPAVQKNKKWIRRFLQLGCLIQVNADSILNWKEWLRIKRYLKRGYIHVIASDSHNLSTRPSRLSQAYDKISKKLGEEYSNQLKLNAEAVIRGEALRKKFEAILE
jgi:protein-tyrosine phosphatase